MLNPAIAKYYKEIEDKIQFGQTSKEGAIRSAFHNLLSTFCTQKNLTLIDELNYLTAKNRPDGTIRNNLCLDCGYWEAKDTSDNLEQEISKKFAKGYPTDNIIFEDSATAVLFQMGMEVMRVEMKNPKDLEKILNKMLSYKKIEVLDFEKAILQFGQNVPDIVKALRQMIGEQSGNTIVEETTVFPKKSGDTVIACTNIKIEPNKAFLSKQAEFFELCKQSINPQITIGDVTEMLIQHILTEDIFLSVFDETQFHRENNIAAQLFELEMTFLKGQTKRDLLSNIEHYYKIIKARASQIADHYEKQKFLKMIYESFYKHYNPAKADTLGVVYTPNEIVKFIIAGTDYLSNLHFGKRLGDRNVKILDPATGTGTFVTELINFLPLQDLEYKYKNEIFCNEIAILPYYVANLNIEYTYKQRCGKYGEFVNIALVDTLDNIGFGGKYKDSSQEELFGTISLENSQRIVRQNESEISIIMGNPPYNANQMNYNDNNANRTYPNVDARIKETYIAKSTAQKTKVYDMYARFLRWASDRLLDNGIVAFVTNGSFIDARTFDGFRKDVIGEFDYIYILDCGGNVRAGDTSGNVFDIMASVAVVFLVKKQVDETLPKWSQTKASCELFYTKLTEKGKENKLSEIGFMATDFARTPFAKIIPDSRGNWLGQTDNDWDTLMPTKSKTEKCIFELTSLGVSTNRDSWVYDLNKENLIKKVKFFIDKYNAQVDKLMKDPIPSSIRPSAFGTSLEREKTPELKPTPSSGGTGIEVAPFKGLHEVVGSCQNFDNSSLDMSIKWSESLRNHLLRKNKLVFDESKIVKSQNRPFVEKWYYSEKIMSDRLTQNHYDIFGQNLNLKNKVIVSKNVRDSAYYCFATNKIQDLMTNGGCVLFPLYRYFKNPDGTVVKLDNISDWALEQFQNHYQANSPSVEGVPPQGGGVVSGDTEIASTKNDEADKIKKLQAILSKLKKLKN